MTTFKPIDPTSNNIYIVQSVCNGRSPGTVHIYGWNSPGRTSLLDQCHKNVCTLGLLTRSVLIEIAWGFLGLVRNCHWTDDIKKYQ